MDLNSKNEDPISENIRNNLLPSTNFPIVFKGILKNSPDMSWECLQWSNEKWSSVLQENLSIRIGERVSEKEVLLCPQWEGNCSSSNLTFKELVAFSEGKQKLRINSDKVVDSTTHWAYFDYFYMKNLVLKDTFEKAINWGLLGYPERGTLESTMWIGTTGANTPCHIDTYGCNLVAQIKGLKRWTLFPKEASNFLYQTRVPYEESSIYSDVGFPSPSLIAHPKLQYSSPFLVTLEPGDVLFVPHHWWHFVENLEFAISINTWLELPIDREERIKEALVMYQIGSLCQGVASVDLITKIINPNHLNVIQLSSSELLEILRQKFLSEIRSNCSVSEKVSTVSCLDTIVKNKKRLKVDTEALLHSHNIHVHLVPKFTFSDYCNCIGRNYNIQLGESILSSDREIKEEGEPNNEEITEKEMKSLVDAFTDSRVIDVLLQVLTEKLDHI